MKDEFKGTKGPWVADIRGGCAAIYPVCRNDDTPGCHADDDRNIAFSSKGAKYNGMHWELDGSIEHDFKLMAAAPELLEALRQLRDYVEDVCAVSSDDCHDDHPLNLANQAIKKALGK